MKPTTTHPGPNDDLVVCAEHLLQRVPDGSSDRCPACHLDTDIAVRATHDVSGRMSETTLRNRIGWGTFVELVSLLGAYLDDRENGPLFLTSDAWPGDDLPAGYNEPERWVTLVGYEWGATYKYIESEQSAQETIESLRDAGYGDD
jgi:hypothetical protein